MNILSSQLPNATKPKLTDNACTMYEHVQCMKIHMVAKIQRTVTWRIHSTQKRV